MIKRFRTIFVCVLAVVLFAFPLNSMAEKPINIGVLVPLSGIVAQGGAEMKMGIQMAAEEKKTILLNSWLNGLKKQAEIEIKSEYL